MLNSGNINNPDFLSAQSRSHRFFSFLAYSVPVLLSIFIFCNPFPYTTSITNISFYSAILIALVLIIFQRINFIVKTPLTYPFALFFLWSCLSLVWALNIENTINDVRGHLLNYLILFFLIINFFNSRNRFNILAWIIVISATVFSVVGMIYYYVILGSPLSEVRFGGLLLHGENVSTELPVNMIGTLFIPALLFGLYFYRQKVNLWHRVAIIFCSISIAMGTVLTQCRGTLVALAIAGVVLLLIKNKKLLPFFLVGILLIVVFSPFKNRIDAISLSERLKINYVALQVVKDYPLLGIGFGMKTFSDNLDVKAYVNKAPEKYRPEIIYGPHNWLLDVVVRVGLIGLALFVLIIFTFIRMCWQIIRYAKDHMIREWGIYVTIAFISYFVIGLVEPVFLFSASSTIFYILMAMMTILWNLNARQGVKFYGV